MSSAAVEAETGVAMSPPRPSHNGKVNGGPLVPPPAPANGAANTANGGGETLTPSTFIFKLTWNIYYLWPGYKVNGSNGSSVKKNGSSVMSNGPVVAEVEVQESRGEEEADTEEVPAARSTDLIFLKSVVLTNTLERPKKVCCLLCLTVQYPN